MPILIAEGITGVQNVSLLVAEKQSINCRAVNLSHAFQFFTLMIDCH
jgi:hypothetical protein